MEFKLSRGDVERMIVRALEEGDGPVKIVYPDPVITVKIHTTSSSNKHVATVSVEERQEASARPAAGSLANTGRRQTRST